MFKFVRNTLNVLFSEVHYFEDGSKLQYFVRLDIIRYHASMPKRVLDIPLSYDIHTGLVSVKKDTTWKWRDPRIALTQPDNSGPVLNPLERAELLRKLAIFVAKQKHRFESL
jgi:hypothetical protein